MVLLYYASPSGLSLPSRPRRAVKEKMQPSSSPFSHADPIPLSVRFAQLKESIASGKEAALTASWHRLLRELRREVERIASSGTDIIPTIDFASIGDATVYRRFLDGLRKRGVAVIRGVVPQETALEWKGELGSYLSSNPSTRGHPPERPQLYEMYWSPPQIKARAHPNMLEAQRFAMGGTWRPGSHHHSPDVTLVSTQHPIAYADRLRIRMPGDGSLSPNAAEVSGGSVERWEPDGYGRAGTYEKILSGRWEEYDPWDSTTRVQVNGDLYGVAGNCSVFRMFQGYLSLSETAPGAGAGTGTMRVCPMLRLTTAYLVLRPFFAPKLTTASITTAAYLEPANWVLCQPQNSILHGALPSYTQELNALLHPHLQLGRSLVSIPALAPGDYVIWHPDVVHAAPDKTLHHHNQRSGNSGDGDATLLYIPACPLTQTNALYLARQRRAFLLGRPGPDFEGGDGASAGAAGRGGRGRGESHHAGRPGVQDVSDAGGDEALQAMGLLPWEDGDDEEDEDEDDNDEGMGRDEEMQRVASRLTLSGRDKQVVGMANAILFPDRFGV